MLRVALVLSAGPANHSSWAGAPPEENEQLSN